MTQLLTLQILRPQLPNYLQIRAFMSVRLWDVAHSDVTAKVSL